MGVKIKNLLLKKLNDGFALALNISFAFKFRGYE